MLYSDNITLNFVTYSYADACRNIFNTIKTSGHSSLEKIYLSLYLKGFERVMKGIISEMGVGNRTELQHIDPPPAQLFRLQQHFFPVLLGCSTGDPGAQPLLGHIFHSSIFSQTDLNFLSPGLYNNLTSTYFLRASHLYSIQPPRQSRLSPDARISLTAWTSYLHRCISHLTSRPGRRSVCYNLYDIFMILCQSLR